MKIPDTMPKRPDELRTYKFNFSRFKEIEAGATCASAVVTQSPSSGASVLTLGGPQIVADGVQFTVAGGTDGIRYLLKCTVTLSTGAILKEAGVVAVVEPTMPSV